jgi:FAD-NAD(P)-binding
MPPPNPARRRGRFVDILLVDPNPGVAGGPAFATTNPERILNTVTQDMTADPADPDGFSRWVRANRHPDAGPFDFVPRSWFGDYLRHEYARAQAKAAPYGPVTRLTISAAAAVVEPDSRWRMGRNIRLDGWRYGPRRLPRSNPVMGSPMSLSAMGAGCGFSPPSAEPHFGGRRTPPPRALIRARSRHS